METNQIRANQWTGFYMITASVMKELRTSFLESFLTHSSLDFHKLSRLEGNLGPNEAFEWSSKNIGSR